MVDSDPGNVPSRQRIESNAWLILLEGGGAINIVRATPPRKRKSVPTEGDGAPVKKRRRQSGSATEKTSVADPSVAIEDSIPLDQTEDAVTARQEFLRVGKSRVHVSFLLDKAEYGHVYRREKDDWVEQRRGTSWLFGRDSKLDPGDVQASEETGDAQVKPSLEGNDDTVSTAVVSAPLSTECTPEAFPAAAGAQKLSKEALQQLKDKGTKSEEVIKHLVQNLRTYESKNEFSQQKYVLKKQKKYIQQITPLPVSLPGVIDASIERGWARICGLRADSLGQVLSHANVRSGMRLLTCDYSRGLCTGAALQRMGGCGRIFYLSEKGRSMPLCAVLVPDETIRAQALRVIPESALKSIAARRSWLEIPVVADDATAEQKAAAERRRQETERRRAFLDDLESGPVDSFIGVLPLIGREMTAKLASKLLLDCLNMAHHYVRPDGRLVIHSFDMTMMFQAHAVLKTDPSYAHVALEELLLREHQVIENCTHPSMLGSVKLFSGYILSAIRVV